MGIFNTAIQTLSNVAIQEAGITLPDVTNTNLVEEMKAKLDGMDYLTEDEMRFTVEMVPVRENRRLGKYLIEMEDLSRYMITNRIVSLKEAVAHSLRYNGLGGQYDNVALVMDEASILDEMAALGIDPKDGEYPEVQRGVGQTVFGHPQALRDIRRISNSKEVLDKLFSIYGLPFIKKNYKQVGLLETVEDVKMNTKPGDKVLQEKDKKPDATSTAVSEGELLDYIRSGGKISDKLSSNPYEKFLNNRPSSTSPSSSPGASAAEASAGGKHGHCGNVNESVEMSDHDRHIQYLRDVVAGRDEAFNEGKHTSFPNIDSYTKNGGPSYNIIDSKNDSLEVQQAKYNAQNKFMNSNPSNQKNIDPSSTAPPLNSDPRATDPRV